MLKSHPLPAVLSRKDLLVLFLLTVVFISNINGVQFGGPSAYVYWVLGITTSLIPCVYITRWLSKCFPGEGGHYLWTVCTLGAHWGFITAFCLWLAGVLAVVSVVQVSLLFFQYLTPGWFNSPFRQCLGIVIIICITASICCLPLRRLKYILRIVTVLYMGVFLLIGAIGVYWLLSGHISAVAFNDPQAWQVGPGNHALFGLVILALLGADVPFIVSGEVKQRERVPEKLGSLSGGVPL